MLVVLLTAKKMLHEATAPNHSVAALMSMVAAIPFKVAMISIPYSSGSSCIFRASLRTFFQNEFTTILSAASGSPCLYKAKFSVTPDPKGLSIIPICLIFCSLRPLRLMIAVTYSTLSWSIILGILSDTYSYIALSIFQISAPIFAFLSFRSKSLLFNWLIFFV